LKKIVFHPSLAIELCYFLAADLRARAGKLEAWDCSLALYMLLEDKKAIIPNEACVSNVGGDQFASHQMDVSGESRVVTSYADVPPSTILSTEVKLRKKLEKIIEKKIYGMRFYHLLSPIKFIAQEFISKVRYRN
jgi:hypothetical protein